MATEKPFEYFPGKIKRLRSLETFKNAVDSDEQKEIYPASLKIRYENFTKQKELLDEMLQESIEKLLEPTVQEVKLIFKTFQKQENSSDFLFLPTICLGVSQIFLNPDEICGILKNEISENSCVILDGIFINSIKDAIISIYRFLTDVKKVDENFFANFQQLIKLYKKLKRNRPIFIIFKNIFAFKNHILNDVLHIFASNLQDFPIISLIIVPICGPFALNSLISGEILRKMNVKFVETPSAKKFFDEFSNCLFSNDEKFLLHFVDKNALNLLNSDFNDNFFSLKRFVNGLKLILLEHFRCEKYSVFCCSEKGIQKNFEKISHEIDQFVDDFRPTAKSPNKRLKTLKNLRISDDIKENLLKFQQFRNKFRVILRCFHEFSSSKNGNLSETYANICDPNYLQSEEFSQIVANFDSLDLAGLKNYLEKCKNICKSDETCSEDLKTFFNDQLENFDTLDEFQLTLIRERKEFTENEPEDQTAPKNGKRRLLYDLKRDLRVKMRRHDETDAFSIRKKEFRRCLLEFFKSLTSNQLDDSKNSNALKSFVVDDKLFQMSFLQQFVRPSVRNAFYKALITPEVHLKSTTTKSTPVQLDCCQIFEQIEASGAKICTRTVLKSFLDYSRSTTTKKKKSKSNDDEEELLRAKFYKILAEFEYLGLLKFAPRKKETVAKLTFFVPPSVDF